MVAEDAERPELLSKITSLVQQFAPSSQWQVDTLLAVLQVSGKYANEEVTSALISIVGNEEDLLASYTVNRGNGESRVDAQAVPVPAARPVAGVAHPGGRVVPRRVRRRAAPALLRLPAPAAARRRGAGRHSGPRREGAQRAVARFHHEK